MSNHPDPQPVDPVKADPLHFAGPVAACGWCTKATPIVWVTTAAQGKPMPVEVGVNEDGNVEIQLTATGDGYQALAIVHASPPGGLFDEFVPYMPHHATCLRNVERARR